MARDEIPGVKVIILTSDAEPNTIRRALQVRADGYVLKDEPDALQEIVAAVKRVLAGGRYFSPLALEKLLDATEKRLNEDEVKAPRFGPQSMSIMMALTDRQKDILLLVGEGYKNEEIAKKLFISPKIVSAHKQNIITALKLKDTSDLAKVAVQYLK
jgi:DNA-binding NarL/FixJ family response regulator